MFILLSITVCGSSSFAQLDVDDIEKFRQYNPDKDKYRFTNTFITSLVYLYANEQRDSTVGVNFDKASDIVKMRDIILINNINLRIARNYMKKYLGSENRLIVKATDDFILFCDELIAYNKEEYGWLDKLYKVKLKKKMSQFDKAEFSDMQNKLYGLRKQSYQQLLETVALINQILVSSKVDYNGELSYLGLTENQRSRLVDRLADFEGQGYEEEDPQQGQSYLQASITNLKTMLSDFQWRTLDY